MSNNSSFVRLIYNSVFSHAGFAFALITLFLSVLSWLNQGIGVAIVSGIALYIFFMSALVFIRYRGR